MDIYYNINNIHINLQYYIISLLFILIIQNIVYVSILT